MKRILLLLLVPLTAFSEPLERIAFGSCNKQDLPQPLWPVITSWKPQLWIWLGDNIYGDTTDMTLLKAKWDKQKTNPGYTKLREVSDILGTWDDHDYGVNDGGKDYAKKSESRDLFLDFLDVPSDDPRWKQDGVYATRIFGEPGRQVRVILLDVRSQRDPRKTDGDILGDAQWQWLEQVLATSQADLHLICSGSQILPTEHKYEKWADYPQSRQRLIDMTENLPGVIFLSGDRHISEISQLESPPLLEITSSGLTHFWKNFPGEPNSLRKGDVFADLSFGTIQIDWETRNAELAIRNASGEVVRTAVRDFGTKGRN
ncbi:MAG: alkaline phosphatase D family protein [Terrimicrobiaceae bacterium]